MVAVAMGTPDHMPHTVQTDKKPITKGEKAKVQDEIEKIKPIILHSKMSKDQEAQLAKDVSEVEKMRKALAKVEHEAKEVKTQSKATKVEPVAKQVAKVEEKVATPKAAPTATVSKVATAEAAAPKAEAPKADAPQAPKVAAPKVVEAKATVTKSVQPEAKAVVHEKKSSTPVKPMHSDVVKSDAAAKMKERMAKAEAKGETMAVAKMSSNSHKHITSTKTNFRRIPVMRPRNFAKTVEQWEAANPVGSKGLLHTGRVHLSHPHIAALPVVKALPWTSTPSPATINSTKATPAALNLGAEKKVEGDASRPEVIAKFTESAQASAERAHKHLEEAKKAFAKTSANADHIHDTGKKIEKTAGTIKYLYSTPEPPPPPTTQAPAPEEKSAANSPRSFLIAASFLALASSTLAC